VDKILAMGGKKMTKILCKMKSCVYYAFIPQEKGINQHQCKNDEIEIDNFSDVPCCFTYKNRLNIRERNEDENA
jgi:hypothetical protein